MAKHPNHTEEIKKIGFIVGAEFNIVYSSERQIDDRFLHGIITKITNNFVFYKKYKSSDYQFREGHKNALGFMLNGHWKLKQ